MNNRNKAISNMKVFVVEDSPEVRNRLCAMIVDVPGARVVGSADGEESALKGIAETLPDLVTLDLHLAGGSGMEVLRELKATQPEVRVVVLTALDHPKYRERLLECGADHYLVKTRDIAILPVLLAEMAAMIDRGQIKKEAA